MTTISIAYEEPQAAITRVQSLLDEVALRDPNWNGADFQIVRDDFTCIVDDDSYDAAALLTQIHDALRGE